MKISDLLKNDLETTLIFLT